MSVDGYDDDVEGRGTMKWMFTYDDESGAVTCGASSSVITDGDGNAVFVGNGKPLEAMTPPVAKVFADASTAMAKSIADKAPKAKATAKKAEPKGEPTK